MTLPTQFLLSVEEAQILLDSLLDIATHPSLAHKDRFPRLRQIYEAMLKSLTKEERRYFATSYARSLFVFDKFQVPQALIERGHFLRRTANKAIHDFDFEPTKSDFTASVNALCDLISYFSGLEPPEALIGLSRDTPHHSSVQHPPTPPDRSFIPFLRAVVLSISEVREIKRADGSVARWQALHCQPEEPADLDRVTILLRDDHVEFGELVWRYATFHVTSVRRVKDETGLYSTTGESLIVLEPDVVMSTTDISTGFSTKEAPNPGIYLLNKFSGSSISQALIIGNIVNSLFDDLISDPQTPFDESFRRAVRQNALTLALLGKQASLRAIHDEALRQFSVLTQVVTEFHSPLKRLEPTFISEVYGIQGRVDVMFVSEKGDRREIVELKSGKAPNASVAMMLGTNRVYAAAWPNHYIQTVCYDLLLRSTYGDWAGTPTLLYSKNENNPLRSVEVTSLARRETVKQRNRLVAIEFQLARGDLPLQQGLSPSAIGAVPPYLKHFLDEFTATIQSLTPLEQAYFAAYVRFIAREHLIARIGGSGARLGQDDDAGFAGLWLKSSLEKKQEYQILSDLKIKVYDEPNDTVYLYRSAEDLVSSFREGDIVVLYPQSRENSLLRNQIVKGTIVHLNAREVHIGLRGTRLIDDYFRQHTEWAVEHDLMDSGFDDFYVSLYEFLRSSSEKRNLLLGRIRPQFCALDAEVDASDLSANQVELVRKALSSQDYFLLQGPPGTGKTSRVLRELVRHLAAQPDETVVLLAFTNKAVEEMCRAISHVVDDYLVLGARAQMYAKQHSLVEYAKTHTVPETIAKIADTRVFVSTVASFLGNQDLRSEKRFSTAIVDEASQLLDVHLVGILSGVQRFILIGDEKQLPAVVTQDDTEVPDDSILAKDAHITDLRSSFFDRLLQTCQSNGWDDAYGMLEYQGRMHKDIQAFPSHEFYDGKLKPFGGWQVSDNNNLFVASPEPMLQALSRARVLFLPSQRERRPKVHRQEAMRAVEIIEALERHFGELSPHHVGVITPFRAQVAEISGLLPDRLRDIVTVDTVERFQGSERDIIIVSFAVNYSVQLPTIQSLSFDQRVDRKLNVAMTRARQHLILLGSPEVLGHPPETHFARLLNHVRAVGGYMSHIPDMDDVASRFHI